MADYQQSCRAHEASHLLQQSVGRRAPRMPSRGRRSASRGRADGNVAAVSHGQHAPTPTTAAASRANTAASKAAWWPWRLTEVYAVLRVLSDILLALDSGDLAMLTLLDLSAAFDSVDHDDTLLTRWAACVFGCYPWRGSSSSASQAHMIRCLLGCWRQTSTSWHPLPSVLLVPAARCCADYNEISVHHADLEEGEHGPSGCSHFVRSQICPRCPNCLNDLFLSNLWSIWRTIAFFRIGSPRTEDFILRRPPCSGTVRYLIGFGFWWPCYVDFVGPVSRVW